MWIIIECMGSGCVLHYFKLINTFSIIDIIQISIFDRVSIINNFSVSLTFFFLIIEDIVGFIGHLFYEDLFIVRWSMYVDAVYDGTCQ